MSTQYWVHCGTTYTVDGIPDDAVPFAVGGPCPLCEDARISMIQRDPEKWRCTRAEHVKPWPRSIIDVKGTTLVVTSDAGVEMFPGTPHR